MISTCIWCCALQHSRCIVNVIEYCFTHILYYVKGELPDFISLCVVFIKLFFPS